jgi:Papain fold toxin 1, glutamine deamidase
LVEGATLSGADSVAKWWQDSKAGFQSATLGDTVGKMLQGFGPVEGAVLGAAGMVAKTAGSIRGVNAVGGTMNCVNCVIAADATLAGRAASALPGGPYRIDLLEKTFGTAFGSPGPIANVTNAMSAAGPGSREIVYGENVGSSVGHVFNVVNQNGVVRLLDSQTGGAASLKGMINFQLLRTN